MNIKSSDLVSLFEESLLKGNQNEQELEEIGIVIQVGDGLCKVHGLTNALFGELILFESGNKGIIFDLTEDVVSLFLLTSTTPVSEKEIAKRTGSVFEVPVGNGLLSRIVNVTGTPIDGLGELDYVDTRPIETTIPGIIERSPIDESLETGILAIDSLVPIGKGQRELIIGNRNTGKSAIALDTIINQKGKNVICVYVCIGQRQATIARLANTLEQKGALDYTVIVAADASETALNRYLAPYAGCSIGEYFMHHKRDVLIIYDDLSEHAIAYREMSLLLRRPAGREAYPGDVFYLHSRLLERAGKLKAGGSLTALPIVQVQSDDITAYIPTNLISITDGQIFLDTKLFNNGIRPAVNIELSVSRVGRAAQTKAIKRMTSALKLELAQYNELKDFAQFGTELDQISQKKLNRGERVIELLKQNQHSHYSFVDQSLMLFLLKEGYYDTLPKERVNEYARQFASYVKSVYTILYERVLLTQDITDNDYKEIKQVAEEFKTIFSA
jgi:F-type H+-transporting ATPase subunit alpha